MSDEQAIAELRRAVDAAIHGHHLPQGVAAAVWSAARPPRRRSKRRLAIMASVLATATVAVTTLAVWGRTGEHTTPPASRSACAGNVTTSLLPTWARAGFTPAGLNTPHVISEHGQIIAVLFVPLRVHQPAGTHNKVLWVAKTGYGPLRIRAQLQGTSQIVTRQLPNGPGPSYVNMPAPGCWQMRLTWSGYHDTIALLYQP